MKNSYVRRQEITCTLAELAQFANVILYKGELLYVEQDDGAYSVIIGDGQTPIGELPYVIEYAKLNEDALELRSMLDELYRKLDAGELRGDDGDDYILTNTDKEEIVDMLQSRLSVDETLNYDGKRLSVNTAEYVEKDNTLPITSAAVETTVGNIEILLKKI